MTQPENIESIRRRERNVGLTVITATFSRFARIGIQLILVAILAKNLDKESYGVWELCNSLLLLSMFADLGLGNGLLNEIGHALGIKDMLLARRAVSSAFFLLLTIAIAVTVVSAAAFPLVRWNELFNVTKPLLINEMNLIALLVIARLVLGILLAIPGNVQAGLQEGFINEIWSVVGMLLGLIFTLLAVQSHAGLPWVVGCHILAPLAASAVQGIILFTKQRPELRPAFVYSDRAICKRLLKEGQLFFVVQLAALIGFQTDNFIIAHVLGPEAVMQYTVPMRLFLLVTTTVTMFLAPLWPAYREAFAQGDFAWVRRTFFRSALVSTGITVPAVLILVLAGPMLIALWIDTTLPLSLSLLLGMGTWAILFAILNPIAILMNSRGTIKAQAIMGTAMATLKIPLSIALVKWIGIPGAIWGTVIALTLCSVAPSLALVPRLLRR